MPLPGAKTYDVVAMAKPWIGIPTRYYDKTESFGQIRHYLDAVIWAGGIPLLIPTGQSTEVLLDYLNRVDGILLPGSPTDIDPARYGEQPHPRLGRPYPERDATDFTLLEYGEKADLPILGICFGAQSLNVFRGGKLIQDIPSQIGEAVAHDDHGDASKPARHLVRLDKESMLARLAGAGAVEVNSFHHQSVQEAGKDLRVSAVAPDGVIEAVEDSSRKFVIGVQWHPERGWHENPFSRALFKAFIEEAEKAQSKVDPV
jgi:putative glutamine amidotransferase